MYKAFEIAGYTQADVDTNFAGMINAFKYGAPPHGGSAPGIDRIVMLLAGEPNIREVVLFPMNQKAEDLMMNAPGAVTREAAARAQHPRGGAGRHGREGPGEGGCPGIGRASRLRDEAGMGTMRPWPSTSATTKPAPPTKAITRTTWPNCRSGCRSCSSPTISTKSRRSSSARVGRGGEGRSDPAHGRRMRSAQLPASGRSPRRRTRRKRIIISGASGSACPPPARSRSSTAAGTAASSSSGSRALRPRPNGAAPMTRSTNSRRSLPPAAR